MIWDEVLTLTENLLQSIVQILEEYLDLMILFAKLKKKQKTHALTCYKNQIEPNPNEKPGFQN